MPKPPLVVKALAKLAQSGITPALAKRLKLQFLPAEGVSALGLKAAGGIRIPYFDPKGKPTGFFRVRYLDKLPGFAGDIAKPQKYDQPAGSKLEVYMPPLIPWELIVKDSDVEVYITEGEFKAACAAVFGYPVLGLGGVYSFRSAKQGATLLPQLEAIAWSGRKVYVVYDNDLSTNLDVMQARRVLANELTSRGAEIYFIDLPPGPLKGLDDFLMAKGGPALQELADKAAPFSASQALWEMNETLVYVRRINAVLERDTSLLMKPDVFVRHTYANKYFTEERETGKGDKRKVQLVKVAAADRWMGWEQRGEVDKMVYEPGKPRSFDNSWNTWSGWGVEPKKGDVGPWKWLMDFLFQHDDKTRQWFERWCAYPLQHPGAKLYSAVLLWSRVKRLGKSMAGLALKQIYGSNAAIIESKDLKKGFNSWQRNKQFVIGEEITAGGEARIDADHLKSLITQQFVTIEEKFQVPYEVRDTMNHLYLSNHLDALFLEDGDERFMVKEILQTEHTRDQSRARYEAANTWLWGDGPRHLFHYLLNLDLGDFNPRGHAPLTASKQAMIRAGKSDAGLWVMQLQEDPASALKPLGDRAAKECDLFTPTQLYRAFDPERRIKHSEAGLGRALGAAGFRLVNQEMPMQTDLGIIRLYAVRNPGVWLTAERAALRAHYNKYFGIQSLGEIK